MRITVGEFGRQADQIEQRGGALALVAFPLQPPIGAQGARQRDAKPQPRIERGLRVLKNHLDARTQRAQFSFAEPADLDAIELDAAGGRLKQTHQQAAERGLAGAGFADEAEHRSTRHSEIDAFDDLAQDGLAKQAAILRIAETKTAGADQNVAHAGPAVAGRSSLRASDHNCSINAGGTGRNVSAGRSARGVAAKSARV